MEKSYKSIDRKMPIKDFSEKKIRSRIIGKLNPDIKKRRSAHDKGLIKIGGKTVLRVKIPNSHTRIMKHSRSRLIATALKLDDNQFIDLIDCPLKGPDYYSILEKIFSAN